MSVVAKCAHASSSDTARPPRRSAMARARSCVRLATSVTCTPSSLRQVAASSAISPAPRISALRPARSPKIFPATATPADARQALPEQGPDGLERGLLFADEIELGPIACREQHATLHARRHHARQGAGHLVRAVRKALTHVERCSAVVDAEDFDADAAVVAHRNRSTPGWASFSAT